MLRVHITHVHDAVALANHIIVFICIVILQNTIYQSIQLELGLRFNFRHPKFQVLSPTSRPLQEDTHTPLEVDFKRVPDSYWTRTILIRVRSESYEPAVADRAPASK